MRVQALPASNEDMPRLFEIACLAFGRDDHVWNTMWPSHWTPAGRAAGSARMLETKKSTPATTYLKAVDTATGEIVGMAKWNLWTNHRSTPGEVRREWYGGEEKEWRYAQAIIGKFLQERGRAIAERGGNLVSLDILTVDPRWQRRGVGDVLVKWGLQKADEMGVDAVVESSVFGRGLYEKNGFVWQKDVEVRAEGEEWEGRPKGAFAWLIREKRAEE